MDRPNSRLRSLRDRFLDIVDLLNSAKLNKNVKLAVAAMEAIHPVWSKPAGTRTTADYLKAGVELTDDLIQYLRPDFNDYFLGYKDLTENDDLVENLVYRHVLRDLRPDRKFRGEADDTVFLTYDLRAGVSVTCMMEKGHGNTDTPNRILVDPVHREEALDLLSHMIWMNMQTNSIALTTTADEHTEIVRDDNFSTLPSAAADYYVDYISRCVEAGIHRSIMFHGPPGTGKSTLARTIAQKLGFRAIRLNPSDIERQQLQRLVSMIKPEVIVIDDIDRSPDADALLNVLDVFKHQIKVVISTANRPQDLDAAVLRPGRTDEIISIKTLDENVVRKLLGPQLQHEFETVRTWPVAYIEEFRVRVQMRPEVPMDNIIEELRSRIERGEALSNEDVNPDDNVADD